MAFHAASRRPEIVEFGARREEHAVEVRRDLVVTGHTGDDGVGWGRVLD